MPIMDRRQVESLLHALGYSPSDEVMTDVVPRVNANIAALRDLDRLGVTHMEPWPVPPPNPPESAADNTDEVEEDAS